MLKKTQTKHLLHDRSAELVFHSVPQFFQIPLFYRWFIPFLIHFKRLSLRSNRREWWAMPFLHGTVAFVSTDGMRYGVEECMTQELRTRVSVYRTEILHNIKRFHWGISNIQHVASIYTRFCCALIYYGHVILINNVICLRIFFRSARLLSEQSYHFPVPVKSFWSTWVKPIGTKHYDNKTQYIASNVHISGVLRQPGVTLARSIEDCFNCNVTNI